MMVSPKNYVKEIFEIDRRSLVLFRILTGLLAIYDGFVKLPHVRWLYSREAYFDFYVFKSDPEFWFHRLLASMETEHWRWAIIAQIVAGVFLIIGKRPKFFLIVWLIVLRMTMRRNQLAAHIGDLVFSFFAYTVLFLPLNFKKEEIQSGEYKNPDIVSSIPFFAQAFAIYFFAALTKLKDVHWRDGSFFQMYVQMDYIWPKFSFFADYPGFLKGLSIALPLLQLFFGLIIFLPVRPVITRSCYIVFWCFFHFMGYAFIPEPTLTMYILFSFIPIIPKEYWDFLFAKLAKIKSFRLQPVGLSQAKVFIGKKILAAAFCFVIISSNIIMVTGVASPFLAEYTKFLSHTFLMQYWGVFNTISDSQSEWYFKLKPTAGSQELIDLPQNERENQLVAGRFLIMKRVLANGGINRWMQSLCIDLKSSGQYPEVYSVVVQRQIRKLAKEPPLKPVLEWTQPTEYICDEINKEPLKYGN